MDPKDYLDRFTYFSVTNPLTGRPEPAPITRWGSNWTDENRSNGAECQTEHNAYFSPAVHMAIDGKAKARLPSRFFLRSDYKKLSAYEGFYKMSTVRAFCGKGSPDEIADTIRLAIVAGRIGTGKDLAGRPPACNTVAQYVTKFMTVDCNGYVGNYYGLNPSLDLDYYATTATRRTRVDQIRQGDVVVTVKPEGKHKHVALIQDIRSFVPSVAGAAGGKAVVTLCEWGQDGPEANHYSTGEKNFTKGPKANYGIGWQAGKNFRYVFAPPPVAIESRGWGLGSRETA